MELSRGLRFLTNAAPANAKTAQQNRELLSACARNTNLTTVMISRQLSTTDCSSPQAYRRETTKLSFFLHRSWNADVITENTA